jgi:carboxyl-terminal processing protease
MFRTLLIPASIALLLAPLACTDSLDHNPDNYAGVGVELTMEAAGARVVRVMDGSPAKEAGLEVGDVLLEIDGMSARGKKLAEVVKKVRGEPGSQLTALARTKGGNKSVTMTRAAIKQKR